jgi:branched-chain amino acid transport system ATP-binding protein
VSAALEVRDLSRRFGGLRALDGITFTVPHGAVLGVIGPNGAGKSTLVNVVSGHQPPSSGRVWINGRELTGAPPWRLARAGVARTFQVMRLFEDLTVLDNVTLSAMYARRMSKRSAGPAARRVLELVGLDECVSRPAGTLTVADGRRLELARALAARPSVLILDEILAGLADGEITAAIELLSHLREQVTTMMIVEHHMQAVRALCDQVIVLIGGRLMTAGPTAEVLADARVIGAYLGRRMPGARW